MKPENVSPCGRLARVFPTLLIIFAFCLFFAPGAQAAPDPAACSANQGSRQLDFWLGNWTVSRADGQPTGASNVSLSLDKCLIVEHWEGEMGHKGETIFAYSPDDKSWHGMFADNEGRVHVFEGQVQEGRAEFEGPSRGPNGQAVLNRVRLIRESSDKLEQTWEKSTDGGKSWTTIFQGEYSRKQS
jgi:hypothetical protein